MNYIRRNKEGIIVVGNKEKMYNLGLKQYINYACIDNLSTYDGRRKASEIILKKTSILPIYVTSKKVLFPTKSLRKYDCIFVNEREILSVKEWGVKQSIITFNDLSNIIANVSCNKIKKQIKRIKIIIKHQNNHKNA